MAGDHSQPDPALNRSNTYTEAWTAGCACANPAKIRKATIVRPVIKIISVDAVLNLQPIIPKEGAPLNIDVVYSLPLGSKLKLKVKVPPGLNPSILMIDADAEITKAAESEEVSAHLKVPVPAPHDQYEQIEVRLLDQLHKEWDSKTVHIQVVH